MWFRCQWCIWMRYGTIAQLISHMDEYHYTCPKCGDYFDVERAISIHGEICDDNGEEYDADDES